MDNSSKNIGSNIRKIREEANLTQAEVAKKAGINVNYFAVIERGEVATSPDKLLKISKALKVDISQIMS
ncbi:helix-turn-helix transcriptional regulator [Patescibacteria group bacterium]|nr:helix-turn-helix transcriptional regulator [Patescibacteria group bacterium]